jgi:hypothetical protein
MDTRTNSNALGQEGTGGNARNTISEANFTDISAAVKADLLNGRRVRAIDYEMEQRPAFWAAIIGLMDRLPIIQRWETLGERHLAGTRLRVRVFLIPAEVRKGLVGAA